MSTTKFQAAAVSAGARNYELRQKRRFLYEENKKWAADRMVSVPRIQWPHDGTANRFNVWRSRDYLVQGFIEQSGVIRLSVNRTELDSCGGWKDGLAWEELQWIKDQCGFSDRDAIEVYPRRDDVVNVANLRHLWIMNHPCAFAWRRSIETPNAVRCTTPGGQP